MPALLPPDYLSGLSIYPMQSLVVHLFSTSSRQHTQPSISKTRLLSPVPPPASSAAAHPVTIRRHCHRQEPAGSRRSATRRMTARLRTQALSGATGDLWRFINWSLERLCALPGYMVRWTRQIQLSMHGPWSPSAEASGATGFSMSMSEMAMLCQLSVVASCCRRNPQGQDRGP
jgi:hypothetical protein